jgi:hypothetical protein
MWYFMHQRAEEIIAERQREALRIRLARLVAEAEYGSSRSRATHSGVRHSMALAIHAVGRSATRLARVLDGDADVVGTA